MGAGGGRPAGWRGRSSPLMPLVGHRRGRHAGKRARSSHSGLGVRWRKGMKPRQGELRPLFLDSVLASDGVHAHPSLQHQALAHPHPVLQILGQIAPAHHLQLPRRIIGSQAIQLNGHFRNRCLVVLGVANLRRLQHLNFKQTVIQAPTRRRQFPS